MVYVASMLRSKYDTMENTMPAFANVSVLECTGQIEVEVFNDHNEAIDVKPFNDENEAVDYALSLGLPDCAINYHWE